MVLGGLNTEEEIWQQLSNPSTCNKAFAELVNRYSEQLYWKIRGIVLDHEDANDVLQNTFLKAWRNISEFHGNSKIFTWLYRIAINESLDFLRRKKNHNLRSVDGNMSIAHSLMADEYFDGDKSAALLQEAIATLPDVQRLVFNLRYFDEMKYSEMSKLLDTSEGALKASYHIAVQKISNYVKQKN